LLIPAKTLFAAVFLFLTLLLPQSLCQSVRETPGESIRVGNREYRKPRFWYLGDYDEMDVTVLVPITFISKAFHEVL